MPETEAKSSKGGHVGITGKTGPRGKKMHNTFLQNASNSIHCVQLPLTIDRMV